MPLLVFRQPLFAIARHLWRPLIPWIGVAVMHLPVWNVLWSFGAYSINTVGFFRGIRILYNIRRYLLGFMSINHLTNFITSMSPILGFMFTNIVKDELIKIARTGFRYGFSRVIFLIIMNAFVLLIRSILYFSVKFGVLIIISVLSVFWFDSLSKFKGLLSLALEIKDWIEDHIGLNIPVLKNRIRPGSFYKFIMNILKEIRGLNVDINKVYKSKPKTNEEVLSTKIVNTEEILININTTEINTKISMVEYSTNIIFDLLIRMLSHSFVEFNLFI
jgi:hypothetical protein